jgi:hypothetical protein
LAVGAVVEVELLAVTLVLVQVEFLGDGLFHNLLALLVLEVLQQ